MKKHLLLQVACLLFSLSAITAQTSTLYFTNSGGSFQGEKWISITSGPDNTGTVLWAQGNGTIGDASGLLTDQAFVVNDGVDFYVNCYDQYDDSWDGTTYEVRDATGGGGILVMNNGGNSPTDGADTDASNGWDATEEERETSELGNYTPPACTVGAGSAVAGVCDDVAGITIDVTVTDLGEGSIVIRNNINADEVTVTTLGTTSIGPFAFGSSVTVTLAHPTDAVCDVALSPVNLPGSCPPDNDECDGAIGLAVNSNLDCGSTTPGTIAFATASSVDATACSGTEDDDVWFSFVATATSHAIALQNVAGGTSDLYHSVWEGGCGSLTLLAGSCSDPNTSTATGLTIGNTYFLRVYSWTSTPGQTSTFDVCIGTNPPPPAEDNCVGAINIPVASGMCMGISTGNNSGATNSNSDVPAPPTATCSSYAGGDIWFAITVPASGNVTISGANSDGCCSYLWYEIYSGADCSALTSIGCSDTNAGSDNNDPSTYETVLTALTPSSTIWIRAWDSSNDNGPGDFNFCAYEPTCAAPTVTIPADPIDNANCPTTVDVSISIDNLGDSGSLIISAMDDLGNPAGTGGMVSATGIFTVTNVPVPQSSWSITIAHESNSICDVVLGPFFLNCPPDNDDACSAEALTVNAAETAGANSYATAQVGEQGGTCWFETTVHNSVWYSFVAPGSGVVTVSTDFAGGTNDDTQLVVYSGDCNDVSTLMAVGCDDDGGTVESFNSIVDVTDLIGGDTYLVQVDGYNGTDGTFNIQVTTPTDPAPANDACNTAEDIPNTNGAGAVVGGTFTQSTGGGMPEACDLASTPDPKDVWYEINTDAGGQLIIQVSPGAGSDVVVAVYNACSTNPGDAEACVDGGGAGVMEEINFTALFQDAGTTSSVRAEDYFLRIYEKTNSGAAFDVAIQGAALPIELSLFEVKAMKLGNEVSWTTESEINSDYVNILASPNGSTKWESIGRVESQGDTYDTKDYSLMDLNPHPVTYYRLESVDRDGTVELSTIISIRRDDQRQNMTLYPNPANDVVNVSWTNEIEETAKVRITGLSGQLFADHNVLLKSGLNTLPLDLVDMPTGVYLITVSTSEETYVKKLVRK